MSAQDDLDRYHKAMHAMQTGVKLRLTREAPQVEYGKQVPDEQECSPKHLRVGVNSALVNSSALVLLLVDKGIITEDEYCATLAHFMEQDVASYQDDLPPGVSLR